MLSLSFIFSNLSAQVSINSDGSEAHASAMLEVESTSKGMLVPRMSTVQRTAIPSPANGLLVFDETTASFWFYDGTQPAWVELSGGASSANEIDDLSDGNSDGSSVFLGANSGLSDDGNNHNTSLGINSLQNITSGVQNVSIGKDAMNTNSTGSSNIAIGFNALLNNVGSVNTAIGATSLINNSSGTQNVGIGTQTLHYNEIGNTNTAIGYKAGFGVSGNSYSGNVFIGSYAGYYETGSNKLYIDNSNTSSPLIGGDFSTNHVEINGTIKITGGNPGSGKVLTSDESGSASWENLAATLNIGINDLTDGLNDNYNLFLGTGSGLNNSGNNYNIGIGTGSLLGNTNGSHNIALGNSALNDNTSGSKNLAIGNNSQSLTTTGLNNVSVGFNTLQYNATGSQNTIIGVEAGKGTSGVNQSGNIFVGYQAGSNETGNNKLYIENSNSSTPLIGGDFTADRVDINGTIKITGGSPGNGKVLTSDVDGNASWEDIPSSTNMSLDDLTDVKYYSYSLYLGEGSGTNSIGNYNNTTGFNSLHNNTTGSSNIAYGKSALEYNSSGSFNVGVGTSSLLYNQTGNANTAIGHQAGFGSSGYNVNGCVFIGYQAGLNNISNNKLFIDNSSTSTPLIEGDFSTDEIDINGSLDVHNTLNVVGQISAQSTIYAAGSITTGNSITANNSLTIGGNVKFTNGSPGAGKVLTSDADGNASWELTGTPAAMSINDLTDATSTLQNVYLGAYSGGGSGEYNTAVGYRSLDDHVLGNSNVAIGSHSQLDNQQGVSNVSVGTGSLYNVRTGNNNVAIGTNAGYGSIGSSQSGNVFIGHYAGYSETGDNKLYIENSNSDTPLIGGDFSSDSVSIAGDLAVYGNFKLTGGSPGNGKILTSDGSGNANWESPATPTTMAIDDLTDANSDQYSIFFGVSAGANDDESSNYNIGIGKESLYTNSSGQLNVAMGYRTLYLNTTGQRNVAIGTYALNENETGNSNTAVGYYSLKNNIANANTAFGYSALSSVSTGINNVGIGSDALRLATGSNNTAIGYQAGENITSLTNTMSLGYNTEATSSNSVRIGNSSITSIGGYAAWSNLSDKRFKNQIKENVAGLEFIMKLRPVTYHFDVHKMDHFLGIEEENPDENSKREKEAIQYTGFIAQEVEQAAREIGYDFSGVQKPQNEKDHYSLAYSEFVVPLVKAVQEQQKQLEFQQQRIEDMQKELEMLKKLIQK